VATSEKINVLDEKGKVAEDLSIEIRQSNIL
jgi:hypothetical protein